MTYSVVFLYFTHQPMSTKYQNVKTVIHKSQHKSEKQPFRRYIIRLKMTMLVITPNFPLKVEFTWHFIRERVRERQWQLWKQGTLCYSGLCASIWLYTGHDHSTGCVWIALVYTRDPYIVCEIKKISDTAQKQVSRCKEHSGIT